MMRVAKDESDNKTRNIEAYKRTTMSLGMGKDEEGES